VVGARALPGRRRYRRYFAGGRSDYITSYDFDGDLNGRNNWENTGEFPLAAHMYYSVVQTKSFTYLIYMFFHPRDWADGSLDDYMEDLSEHENDSEGALVVVADDGTAHGKLQAVVTVAHKDFYSWLPAGSDFSSGDEDVDGAIAMTSSPHDTDGHQRPWTAAQANTHASTYDGLHPNALGEYRIAKAFGSAVHDKFHIGSGVPSVPSSAPTRVVATRRRSPSTAPSRASP
jgi:hypothetical protein